MIDVLSQAMPYLMQELQKYAEIEILEEIRDSSNLSLFKVTILQHLKAMVWSLSETVCTRCPLSHQLQPPRSSIKPGQFL